MGLIKHIKQKYIWVAFAYYYVWNMWYFMYIQIYRCIFWKQLFRHIFDTVLLQNGARRLWWLKRVNYSLFTSKFIPEPFDGICDSMIYCHFKSNLLLWKGVLYKKRKTKQNKTKQKAC